MNIPGFTAETSLYRTSNHYRSGSLHHISDNRVHPADCLQRLSRSLRRWLLRPDRRRSWSLFARLRRRMPANPVRPPPQPPPPPVPCGHGLPPGIHASAVECVIREAARVALLVEKEGIRILHTFVREAARVALVDAVALAHRAVVDVVVLDSAYLGTAFRTRFHDRETRRDMTAPGCKP